MIVQLIFTSSERQTADSILKMLFRLVPHADETFTQTGDILIHAIETDRRKEGGNGLHKRRVSR